MFPAMAFVVCALSWSHPCRATIQYQVSISHPEQHLFHVTMTIPDVSGEVTVQLPAWNALYQIRDFSSHIQQVEAFAGSVKAPIEKVDKQTWRVTGQGTLSIRYETYWDDAGPFATQLNGEHAFINPAMILLYVPDRRGEAADLFLEDVSGTWNVASSVHAGIATIGGVRIFVLNTKNYDALVDAPVEVGNFKEFSVPGVPTDIRVVVHGDNWGQRKIEGELSRICNYELKLMDGAPFEHYVFILHIGKGAGGGGMEHANSTAIGIPSDDYLSGVAAHEFFHLWNVKRIRPATLEPVDYTKEQYTRALWFAEGVTSTYGAYTLVRSGIWNKERFYADLGEQISELEARPANRWQSAEQSSLDAWLEKYPLYNGPDDSVSYYTKGQVLGDLLDILIRDRTGNEKSLDDVLRGLNTDFAKKGKTYRDSLDIRLEAEKVAGGSFEEFFRDYVAAAEPLPYQHVLALAGLEVRTIEHKRALLGFSAERESAGTVTVRTVDDGSPAAQAGLRVGDVIESWNDADVPRSLGRWARERQPGETVRVRVRREEKERTLDFKLGEEKELLYQVAEDVHANEKARRIREGLLRGVTQTATVH
ncbi:MAG TPA: PDZ domain-containing protein [Candidatus Binatus sp.]|jgi:predicted metalloprotease with PDZ domain|nr:PDZ domain-containing protein [Candidatus Binatus sp.]